MEEVEAHRQVLKDVIGATGDISVLVMRLQRFRGWDVEPLVVLGADEVANVLQRYLDGLLSVAEVGMWSEALELRDDVEFGDRGFTARAVQDLASEGLGARPITPHVAREILVELR